MDVHIHQAGGDDKPGGVDDLGVSDIQPFADGGDLPAGDQQIQHIVHAGRRIEHPSVFDEQVHTAPPLKSVIILYMMNGGERNHKTLKSPKKYPPGTPGGYGEKRYGLQFLQGV